MKINQKGFSVVEILIIIAVVGIVGAVGWLVYDRQKDSQNDSVSNTQPGSTDLKDQSDQTDNTKDEIDNIDTEASADSYAGWKSYSKNGYVFKYPSDWKLIEQPAPRITSSNYNSTGTQPLTVTAGAVMDFHQTDIPDKNLTADNYKDSPSGYGGTNFKTVTINGKKAVQYNVDDTLITVFFKTDGTRVHASINYASDDSEASLKTYNLLLSTVEVN